MGSSRGRLASHVEGVVGMDSPHGRLLGSWQCDGSRCRGWLQIKASCLKLGRGLGTCWRLQRNCGGGGGG